MVVIARVLRPGFFAANTQGFGELQIKDAFNAKVHNEKRVACFVTFAPSGGWLYRHRRYYRYVGILVAVT